MGKEDGSDLDRTTRGEAAHEWERERSRLGVPARHKARTRLRRRENFGVNHLCERLKPKVGRPCVRVVVLPGRRLRLMSLGVRWEVEPRRWKIQVTRLRAEVSPAPSKSVMNHWGAAHAFLMASVRRVVERSFEGFAVRKVLSRSRVAGERR